MPDIKTQYALQKDLTFGDYATNLGGYLTQISVGYYSLRQKPKQNPMPRSAGDANLYILARVRGWWNVSSRKHYTFDAVAVFAGLG